jgi:hypothetical protein
MILSTTLIILTSTVTAPRSCNSSVTLDGGNLVILQVSRHGRKRLTSYISSRGPFPDSQASFLPPGTNNPTPSVTKSPNTQIIYSISQCLRHLPSPLLCHHIRLRCPFVLLNDSVLQPYARRHPGRKDGPSNLEAYAAQSEERVVLLEQCEIEA